VFIIWIGHALNLSAYLYGRKTISINGKLTWSSLFVKSLTFFMIYIEYFNRDAC